MSDPRSSQVYGSGNLIQTLLKHIVADYARAGDVKTGSLGEQAVPTEAELSRRAKLRKEAA